MNPSPHSLIEKAAPQEENNSVRSIIVLPILHAVSPLIWAASIAIPGWMTAGLGKLTFQRLFNKTPFWENAWDRVTKLHMIPLSLVPTFGWMQIRDWKDKERWNEDLKTGKAKLPEIPINDSNESSISADSNVTERLTTQTRNNTHFRDRVLEQRKHSESAETKSKA